MLKKLYHTSLPVYLWVIATLLWCYIIYRAFSISVTQDEAFSYLLVKTDYWRAMPGSANTHWLNSLFMRLFLWLPGADDPWKLRMLSVLCWPVFAYAVIQLTKGFRSRWLGLLFFGAMVLNPFIIFYFSLGRGYAAGCAFLLLSVWLAASCMRKNNYTPKGWTPVFFAAALAVVANFSFFYFYVALTGMYLFQLVYTRQVALLWMRAAVKWWMVVLGTFVIAGGLLFFLRARGDLFHGGKSDLVASLVGSVISTSVHVDDFDNGVKILSLIIFALLMLFCVAAGYRYYHSGKITVGILMTGVCGGIVLLNILFKISFGTLYLLERTALVVYLPLVLGLAALGDEMMAGARRPVTNGVTAVLTCLLCGVFVLNFYKSFSVRYFREWTVQADTKKCLDQLAALGALNVGMSAWQRDVFYNYYSKAYPEKYTFRYGLIGTHLPDLKIEEASVREYDYLLLDAEYSKGWEWKRKWDTVEVYPVSGVEVLRRKSSEKTVRVEEKRIQ